MIQIKNAEKYFNRNKSNEIHVINDISLDLPQSGMIAIFGRSGCGKTTLLNCVGGLDSLASGAIEIDGHTLTPSNDEIRNKYIGYIFQNYNLNNSKTCYENVADALHLCGLDDPEEIDKRVMVALKNVDMDKYKKRTPDTLSGGQQQRIAIARAIVKNPSIILADEPTGNLDEENTVKVMNLLKAFSKDHLVLLVTHEANLVDYYCDKVIELSDGRVVGTKDNSDANGFAARSKNDIYLGEYELNESRNGNVILEYYGEPTDEIRLRVVNAGGRIFLESLNPSVRFLDNSSEIKLVQGKYSEAQSREIAEQALDLSTLTPIESEKTGRLYTLRSSITESFRTLFSGKKRKLTRFERFALFAMAFSLVFLTATSGKNLKQYFTAKESCSKDLLFIKTKDQGSLLDSKKDNSFLEPNGENRIDFVYTFNGSEKFTTARLTFFQANFISVQVDTVSLDTTLYDSKLLSNLPVVAGTKELKKSGDIVISTKAADELLKNSSYSFINDYNSLIGMTTNENSNWNKASTYSIVGVVKADDNAVYMPALELANYIYTQASNNRGMAIMVAPESQCQDILKGKKVQPGTYIDYSRIIVKEPSEYPSIFEDDDITDPKKDDDIDIPDNNDTPADPTMDQSITVLGMVLKMADQIVEETTKDDYYSVAIMTDADFLKLARISGKIGQSIMDDFGFDWYTPEYLLVHSSDVKVTKTYLESKGVSGIMMPDDVLKERLHNDLRPFISTAIAMGIITAVMCLTLFFIMRASLLSRIKEIGINRAIGVSKQNLCFRFLVETALLMSATVVLGFILATICVKLLSNGTLLEHALFFPPVIALLLFIILAAASLLAGILPVILLLRKTPSAILSKYDI